VNVLTGMERIGEVVAGVLGLEDSKFQYVIDGMTEEDWKEAIEVNKLREEENAQHEQALEADALESGQGSAQVYCEATSVNIDHYSLGDCNVSMTDTINDETSNTANQT
jgi:hypothetical protein